MKPPIEEFFDIVYRYYARGVSEADPNRGQTEENLRLMEARRQAGADCSRWLDTLRRLGDQFPERGISNLSIHLVTGGSDACYSGSLSLPDYTDDCRHTIEFRVSFLVPYYIVFSSRIVEDLEELERMKARLAAPKDTVSLFFGDTMFVLPAGMVKPEFRKPPPLPKFRPRRRDISYEFSADEQSFAERIAQEIEAIWGYERMPPDVGSVIVPDVATNHRALGEATLFDCLFSDGW
jgi:hypothetical protein